MPRYNFDLSEYQQPEFEFPWEGCSDLSPTHLPNYVSYFSETKTLHISVEGPQEYDSMLLLTRARDIRHLRYILLRQLRTRSTLGMTHISRFVRNSELLFK